jgi:hypothetical protein
MELFIGLQTARQESLLLFLEAYNLANFMLLNVE